MDAQTAYDLAADVGTRVLVRVDALYAVQKAVGRNFGLIIQTEKSRKNIANLGGVLIDDGVTAVRHALASDPPYKIGLALDRMSLGAFACDLAYA